MKGCLILLILACCMVPAWAHTKRPNVLIMVADQLRYQSVGFAGDAKAHTPNIDQLAREGLNCHNFVANTPVCSAFRASLMTGKYASSTGLVVNELRVNPDQDSLAHALNQAGYHSELLGKWHLWANQAGHHDDPKNGFVPPGPYRMGFDSYWAGFNYNHSYFNEYYFRDTPERIKIKGFGATGFTNLAIDRFKAHKAANTPFFMFIGYSPPHDPWVKNNVPVEWMQKFKDVKFDLPPNFKDQPDPYMDRQADPKRWKDHWTPNLESFMRCYYAQTAALDAEIGRIMKALKDLKMEEDTIVIFTSDHGEMFGAQGRIFKMTFYEESARVPFVIRWPGRIKAGEKLDACISTVDVMPTVLGLCGQPVPPQVDGMDLSGRVLGKPGPEPEFALLQGMGHTFLWENGFEWRALRDKRYTYARYLKDGRELLFDNIQDPFQMRDLAGTLEGKPKLEELRGKMNGKMREIGDEFKPCTWYRDAWTKNREIVRGARGEFKKTLPSTTQVAWPVVSAKSRKLSAAGVGPVNRWPKFRFQQKAHPVEVSGDLSEEDKAGMFKDTVVPSLPYLIQDNYTRQRSIVEMPTMVVENQDLRAECYPKLGGRMMSLIDKKSQRELLFNNPVFQPANLAIRNAWFSGGVEWNGPLFGHSLLTCSPVYAGIVQTQQGPMLRMYEFDRSLEMTWQVDILAPAGSDKLCVHVKARNPNNHDIPFYWWTNIAVPLAKGTRVLSPADYMLAHESKGNQRLPFPNFAGFDGSYPALYPHAKSVFFRKPGQVMPWSVCVDDAGQGLAHVSTEVLSGRKFFVWGGTKGGKRWMDFLSEDDKGDYIEVQGGITPTQLQARTIKAGGCLEWTECLSSFLMDGKSAHDPDYQKAVQAAATNLQAKVTQDMLASMHAFMSSQADAPIAELVHSGSGWGHLHEIMTGRKISPGLLFEPGIADGEKAWSELLQTGRFSAKTLQSEADGFAISPGWLAVIEKSALDHGPTWLHQLHLAIGHMEAGRLNKAMELLKSSVSLKPSAQAHRSIALLNVHAGKLDQARMDYMEAWKLCPTDANLAVEIAAFLMEHKLNREYQDFISSCPADIAGHERIILMNAKVAVENNEFDKARQLLQREFATIREGEVSLSETWFNSWIREFELKKTKKLSDAEIEQIKVDHPPPRQIDFRMK